ncbi:MAG: DUF1987 domain-containing protein [Bacteroidales bacterium]|nr:DUF1987 domain-containing protein [Bacteroidales bacterium]
MVPLKIEPTEDTPEIILDKESQVFRISGDSYSDDPFPVFRRVFEWLEIYEKNPNNATTFDFILNYVNTASHKQIADILMRLESFKPITNVLVKWHYRNEDDDMLDEGRALEALIKVDFDFVEYT